MLIPDNIHPENSIYYNEAFVLKSLQKSNSQNILELYYNVKQSINMSFSIFILCLDWLYLIDVAKINSKGKIILCS
ncbi:ABC-three component system middle component 6 [Flavobacterium psychrophilum]|uniref:ABC-three component system middle component 6 n=1 Tax=Flavobacterium psychrophilum TaxID=96345 RepID=UPI0010695843|nr:ABC-three component system middle component 6 [Flavobacterium psychrophilum]